MDIDVVLEELKEKRRSKRTSQRMISTLNLKKKHTEELVIVIDNLYTEKI